jgi:ATPase subunit of ABC transporter with duplicated ATPase domains
MTETSSGDSQAGIVEQGKEQVQESAGRLGEKVQETAQQQVDQRSTDAGEKVKTLSTDLRSVSERLREDGNDGPAGLADQVADRAERLGGYLTESDANTILGDVEDAVRRQPWLALAGGIAVGVAAARLLKASGSDRYRTRGQTTSVAQQGPTREIPSIPAASPAPTAEPVAAPLGSS